MGAGGESGKEEVDLFEQMREAFGHDLAECYDSWMRVAQRLVSGERNPKAPPTERAREDLIGRLGPEDRRLVFTLCQEMVFDALFCVMNLLDGTRASYLPRDGRYKLVAELVQRFDGQATTTAVELNPPWQVEDLHDSLLGWLERFSTFGPPPL